MYKKKSIKKKAESQTHAIMWIGVIIAIIICVLWAVKNIQPRHIDLETVDSDLEYVQGHIASACSSYYYKAKFNPKTVNGELHINNSMICITNSFSKCRGAMCDTGINITIPLDNITYVVIEKNQTFVITTE